MKRIKKGDYLILILFIIVLIAGVIFYFYQSNSTIVQISVNGKIYKEFPLQNKIQNITVKTSKGYNQVTIQDKTVKVTAADCPNQVCVHTKAAHMKGDTITCIPHKVIITIK